MATSFSSMGFRGTPRPVINFRPTIITGDSIEVAEANDVANINSLAKMTNASGRQLKRSRITDDDTVINIQTDLLSVSGELQCPTVTALQTATDDLESRAGTLESQTTALQTTTGSLGVRTTALETTTGSLGTRTTALETSTGSLGTRTTTLETTTAALGTTTAALESKSNTLATRATTLETKTQKIGVNAANETTFSTDVRSSGNIYAPNVGIGNTSTTGYFLPFTKIALANYALVTPPPPGNVLEFTNAISNITAAPLSTSFNGRISTTGTIAIINGASSYKLPIVGPTTVGAILAATDTIGTLAWGPPAVAAESAKIVNIASAIPTVSTSFTGGILSTGEIASGSTIQANGAIKIVNGLSSYSLPLVGPSAVGSILMATNTTGTLAWRAPSYLRAWRSDNSAFPVTHTFTTANFQLPFLLALTSSFPFNEFQWVGDGTVKYTGIQPRTFSASLSVYFQGETKNMNSEFILIMKTTGSNIQASSRFLVKDNVSAHHTLFGVGQIFTNDVIEITLINVVANVTISSGSPSFTILLN